MQMRQDNFAYETDNFVGTWYSPTQEECIQPRACEYGVRNSAGIYPREAGDVQYQSGPLVGDDFDGVGPTAELSMPHYSERTMSYEGKTYPYWMPEELYSSIKPS